MTSTRPNWRVYSGASPLGGSNTGKNLLQGYRGAFQSDQLIFAEDLGVRVVGSQYGSGSQNGPQRRQPVSDSWGRRDVELSKSWDYLKYVLAFTCEVWITTAHFS